MSTQFPVITSPPPRNPFAPPSFSAPRFNRTFFSIASKERSDHSTSAPWLSESQSCCPISAVSHPGSTGTEQKEKQKQNRNKKRNIKHEKHEEEWWGVAPKWGDLNEEMSKVASKNPYNIDKPYKKTVCQLNHPILNNC